MMSLWHYFSLAEAKGDRKEAGLDVLRNLEMHLLPPSGREEKRKVAREEPRDVQTNVQYSGSSKYLV